MRDPGTFVVSHEAFYWQSIQAGSTRMPPVTAEVYVAFSGCSEFAVEWVDGIGPRLVMFSDSWGALGKNGAPLAFFDQIGGWGVGDYRPNPEEVIGLLLSLGLKDVTARAAPANTVTASSARQRLKSVLAELDRARLEIQRALGDAS